MHYIPKSDNRLKINTLTLIAFISFTTIQIIQFLYQNHVQNHKIDDPNFYMILNK